MNGEFDMQRLTVQLSMLPYVIRTAFLGSAAVIKKVTNIRTISDAMNRSAVYKGMLPEVDNKLYMTFLVTSAMAECSFSSLHLIKTYLRSTMMEYQLNNFVLLYVHEKITDGLNLAETANSFVSVNQRRINCFGNFVLLFQLKY